jgi:hypothetical protein
MIHWDSTINLGTVIAFCFILIPVLKLLRYQDIMSFKVDEMWKWYKRHIKITEE